MLGALVSNGYFWISATIAVLSLFLLELKGVLEGLSKRLAPHEILTFTKFLLLTAVILPTVPNTPFTQFGINPFKTWLLVVAVCGISYGSYVLLALTRQRDGVLLSGLLGGVYSSTATTVALAKKASVQGAPYLFSGGILVASAMMYLRMTVLLMLFSGTLRTYVGGAAYRSRVCSWDYRMALVTSSASRNPRKPTERSSPEIPWNCGPHFIRSICSLQYWLSLSLVIIHFGNTGIYGLASVTGLVDVDAFILGMTQSAGALTPVLWRPRAS